MASNLSATGSPVVLDRLEVAPATGSTTVIPPYVNMIWFTNPGTIAAQTVTLPASPVDGQTFYIANTAAITALTLSPTVLGVPSGLTAGQGLVLMYSGPSASWFVRNS
jgi:hypothetical protein